MKLPFQFESYHTVEDKAKLYFDRYQLVPVKNVTKNENEKIDMLQTMQKE